MAHLQSLRVEVRRVRRARRGLERDALGDLEPVQGHELVRIVREQADAPHAEVREDLHADPVLALIRPEAEPLVRLDRVEALVLQLVGAKLVHEPDATALLPEIQKHAAALGRDALERGRHLLAAIAAKRPEDIAGEALRMHAYE